MSENSFLAAKAMAQDLVRGRIEPDHVSELVSHLQEQKDDGVKGFMDYVLSEEQPEPLKAAYKAHLSEVEQVEDIIDILGWCAGFMRYYRGEGTRPHPKRRPSEPRRASRPAPAAQRPRAPRQEITSPISSLTVGQALQGTVRRIMPYGVFVAVGAERDGLVHVSELQDGFTGDPNDVVSMNDTVEVWVKSIDLEQRRISLTMKGAQAAMAEPRQERAPQPRSYEGPRPSASSEGAGGRSSGGGSEGSGGRPSRRRRSDLRGRTGPARLYEDEAPKEATTLGDALRLAMERKESDDDEPEKAKRKKKPDGQPDEMTEALRRTLYG